MSLPPPASISASIRLMAFSATDSNILVFAFLDSFAAFCSLLIYLVASYFHQLELQLLDMLYHVTEFVTRLWRETSIICKSVKLFDDLITSTVHVLSFE
jgi:hypothetical protein